MVFHQTLLFVSSPSGSPDVTCHPPPPHHHTQLSTSSGHCHLLRPYPRGRTTSAEQRGLWANSHKAEIHSQGVCHQSGFCVPLRTPHPPGKRQLAPRCETGWCCQGRAPSPRGHLTAESPPFSFLEARRSEEFTHLGTHREPFLGLHSWSCVHFPL